MKKFRNFEYKVEQTDAGEYIHVYLANHRVATITDHEQNPEEDLPEDNALNQMSIRIDNGMTSFNYHLLQDLADLAKRVAYGEDV